MHPGTLQSWCVVRGTQQSWRVSGPLTLTYGVGRFVCDLIQLSQKKPLVSTLPGRVFGSPHKNSTGLAYARPVEEREERGESERRRVREENQTGGVFHSRFPFNTYYGVQRAVFVDLTRFCAFGHL